ncbi:hypothetical protein FD754_019846 [Muntiacus muntjak]|uniref:Uncharacterized protein n=1 Tax=Muntiacus muntjak TaxID=9888 RepID=A0A5N3V2U4_MUNMU|nr:hypothetical protein FD754_019846 [Muntiacus muntjak]
MLVTSRYTSLSQGSLILTHCFYSCIEFLINFFTLKFWLICQERNISQNSFVSFCNYDINKQKQRESLCIICANFNISLSNEHRGLISFRMDWLDLLAVQGTLKSLLQHHSSKASILRVVSSAYLRLLIFLLPILIPACASSSPARVPLCVTPSLGFSRQENWSGLPFPSPMHKNENFSSEETQQQQQQQQQQLFKYVFFHLSLFSGSLASRRKRLTAHFEDLEQCYFSTRMSRISVCTLFLSIEFDRDCDYFAIAGVTKKIKVYEYGTVIQDAVDIHYPENEMTCNSKISCISWSSYHKNLLASSDYEGTVILWDGFTGQRSKVYQEHEKRCWSVDFNLMDPKLLASGSDDAKVKLWSTNLDNSVASIEAKANVCCVKFSPSSRYHLAFGCAGVLTFCVSLSSTDSQLKLWNVGKPYCLRSFKGHINEKNFVGLASNGDYIACGSENNSLYLYYKGLSKTLLTFKFDTVKSVLDKDRKEDDTNEFVSAVCWRALPDGVSTIKNKVENFKWEIKSVFKMKILELRKHNYQN